MSSLYAVENMSPLDMEKNIAPNHNRRRESNMLENDGRSPKENGQQRSNGIEASSKSEQSADKQPDIVDDHPGKSRSTFNSCHTSLIVYAYWFFQNRYFIKSWWAGAEAWVQRGPWVRVWVLVPGGVRARVQVLVRKGEWAEVRVLVEVLLVPLKGAEVSLEVLLELIAVEVQPVVSAEVQQGARGIKLSVEAQWEPGPRKALAGAVKDPYLEEARAGTQESYYVGQLAEALLEFQEVEAKALLGFLEEVKAEARVGTHQGEVLAQLQKENQTQLQKGNQTGIVVAAIQEVLVQCVG